MIVMFLNSYKLVSETHAIMWPKIMHLENHLISVQVLQNSWNLKCVYFDRKFTSICFLVVIFLASLVAQRIKRLPAMQETRVWSLGWEDPKALTMGSLEVGHDWATSLSLFTFMHWRRKWQPTPVFLPGESQGQRSLVGCRLCGRIVSDTTEAT